MTNNLGDLENKALADDIFVQWEKPHLFVMKASLGTKGKSYVGDIEDCLAFPYSAICVGPS